MSTYIDTHAPRLVSDRLSGAVAAGVTPPSGPDESHGAGDAPEPAAPGLFAGLGAAWVPAFCDVLLVDLAADGAGTITETYPPALRDAEPVATSTDGGEHVPSALDGHPGDDAGHLEQPRPGRIVVAVHSEPMVGEPPITGTITCIWHDRSRPNSADVVVTGLLADRAVATARMHSLGAALQTQLLRAANLEQALATNRQIGQAIGILMATDHLTAAQAFERLRTASQHSHRKLRDVASDVIETGVLTVSELVRDPVMFRPVRESRLDRRTESSPSIQRRTRGGQPCAVLPTQAAALPAD
ncbi:MAG: hypothetical protein DLM57_12030 [Pseudonocardiales bacterium]|nr:MAG: hypothetical protein DLM57_12030 [Pseudonocardiales bacterium]